MPRDIQTCNRLLIFGGTFDPPQVAHVTLPPLVADAVGADGIVYIPAAQSPLKAEHPGASAEHRLAMIKLATMPLPRAIISDIELVRGTPDGRPSYTIDTLETLRSQLRDDVEMRLLIGGDQLRQFHRWHRFEDIERIAEPVVMVRPPDSTQTLLDALPEGFDRETWAGRLVDVPRIHISATAVRDRIRADEPIHGLVPPAVERYIHRNNLYHD